jgi:hypothetical protein
MYVFRLGTLLTDSQRYGPESIYISVHRWICTSQHPWSQYIIQRKARLIARLCKLKDHWKSIFETGTPSLGYVNSAIDTMISQCEALMARFFTKDCQFPPKTQGRQKEVY